MDTLAHIIGPEMDRDYLSEAFSIAAGSSNVRPEPDHILAVISEYESRLRVLRAGIEDDRENLREVHVLHGREMP